MGSPRNKVKISILAAQLSFVMEEYLANAVVEVAVSQIDFHLVMTSRRVGLSGSASLIATFSSIGENW